MHDIEENIMKYEYIIHNCYSGNMKFITVISRENRSSSCKRLQALHKHLNGYEVYNRWMLKSTRKLK